MKSAAQIRQDFIDFFKARGHTFVPSAPVAPNDDPTLMFTNAGMNQFKDVFLGTGTRPYTRAVNSQKCIRAGGKHNDLEDVGWDSYHHTFFEMLGNWSFGDYYKSEAITWAWELLTEVWGLDKSRLYATIYRTDDEAFEIWKSQTDIDPARILRFDEKDNFWEMAATGPCGPCSEIHYDRGEGFREPGDEVGPEGGVNSGSSRFIEIWNLVFMQNERLDDGSLRGLPAKHVDTGMGLERIVAILQGKNSNYDTDLFLPIIEAIAERAGAPYDFGWEGRRHRAIADHLRALSFSIADGARIDPKGRGSVLRRILRRASRFLGEMGVDEPLLYDLVPVVVANFAEAFPELKAQQQLIQDTIQDEEKRFLRTLSRGLKLFSGLVDSGARQISGADAFKLHDTFGFPIDLTKQMAKEKKLTVDEAGFEKLLEKQRKRGQDTQTFDKAKLDRFGNVPATEFLGYERERVPARVLAATREEIVLDRTPFYPEGGGPKGDIGLIAAPNGAFEFKVTDTQKLGDLVVHRGEYLTGDAGSAVGEVEAVVDGGYRAAIRRNHTATHLLHWALREVLGPGATQQGSVIKPEAFSFDFLNPGALTDQQLTEIERLVNERIMANELVAAQEMSYDEALEAGALALFSENYGAEVRVLSIGDGFSTELCGGIHVHRTGDIGAFKIIRESSVAAGIRRIEAVAGAYAVEAAIENHRVIQALSQSLKTPVAELADKVAELQKQVKKLKKSARSAAEAKVSPKDLLADAEDLNGVRVLIRGVEGEVNALRKVGDSVKAQADPTFALLAARGAKGVGVLAACSKSLVEKGWSAQEFLKVATGVLGGGGGGRDDFAQGKGKDASKIDEALDAVRAAARSKAGAS